MQVRKKVKRKRERERERKQLENCVFFPILIRNWPNKHTHTYTHKLHTHTQTLLHIPTEIHITQTLKKTHVKKRQRMNQFLTYLKRKFDVGVNSKQLKVLLSEK